MINFIADRLDMAPRRRSKLSAQNTQAIDPQSSMARGRDTVTWVKQWYFVTDIRSTG